MLAIFTTWLKPLAMPELPPSRVHVLDESKWMPSHKPHKAYVLTPEQKARKYAKDKERYAKRNEKRRLARLA